MPVRGQTHIFPRSSGECWEEVRLINKMGVTWLPAMVILDDTLLIKLPCQGNRISQQGVRENIVMRKFLVLDTEDIENHTEILLNGSFLSNNISSKQMGYILDMSHFKLLKQSVTDHQKGQTRKRDLNAQRHKSKHLRIN